MRVGVAEWTVGRVAKQDFSPDGHGLFLPAPTCNAPLGMKDGTIPNSQITASSEFKHSVYHGTANARLDFTATASRTGAWSAQTNDGNQWLQVEFSKRTKVTGIDTQGRNGCCSQWVTKFTVSYRDEGEDSFKDYKENGVVKASNFTYIFVNNCVRSTLCVSHFRPAFHCRNKYEPNLCHIINCAQLLELHILYKFDLSLIITVSERRNNYNNYNY